MTPRTRRVVGREWLLVAASFAAIVVTAAVWLGLDRRPPEWDHANHLERAVLCARDLASADAAAILARSSFYPPLVPCAAGLAYRLVGSDVVAGQSVVLLFLGLGMAAVYLLGRALHGGTAGLGAAWIFGTAPSVAFLAVRFQLDLPLAAMVAVGLLALHRTERLQSMRPSVVLGLVTAIGMLTKPSFIVYLAPCVLVVLLAERNRRAMGNAALAGLVAGTLSLPWYGPRLFALPAQIESRSFAQAAESGHAPVLSWTSLSFYPTWIWTELGVVGVVLAAVGVAIAAMRRDWVLPAGVLAPLILFGLLQNKNLRYVLPVLPAMAVLGGVAIGAASAGVRAALGLVLVPLGILQVTSTTFGVPAAFTLPLVGRPFALSSPPTDADWHHRELLDRVVRDSRGAVVTVSVIPNADFFSTSNFRYYSVRDGLPVTITRAWDRDPLGVEYMLLKTGYVGPTWTAPRSRRVADRLATDLHLARIYPVIAEFPLPDGSVGSLRARRIPEAAGTAPEALARAMRAAVRGRLADVARDVEGVDVRLVDDSGLARGRIGRVELSAGAATIGELTRPGAATLRVRNLEVVAHDVLFNPLSLAAEGRLDLLDVGHLRFERGDVAAADFQDFLGGLKAFRRARATFGAGTVTFQMSQAGPDVSARVRLLPAVNAPFQLDIDRVRFGWLPVPEGLTSWIVRHYDPTRRVASRLPFSVAIGPVSVTEHGIRIGNFGRMPRHATSERRLGAFPAGR